MTDHITFDPLAHSPQCIITGCSFLSPSLNGAHLNGDLYELGDCYIFNANPQLLAPQDFAYKKTVTARTYFVCRHVYVFLKTAAELSQDALEYLGSDPGTPCTMPTLPEVPDVISFEDETGREALRRWALEYGAACAEHAAKEFA